MSDYATVATTTRLCQHPLCQLALRLLHRHVQARSLSSAAAPARARADDPPHPGQYHRGTMATPGLFYLPLSLRAQTNAAIQCLTTPMYCSIDASTEGGGSRRHPHRIGAFQQPLRTPPTDVTHDESPPQRVVWTPTPLVRCRIPRRRLPFDCRSTVLKPLDDTRDAVAMQNTTLHTPLTLRREREDPWVRGERVITPQSGNG